MSDCLINHHQDLSRPPTEQWACCAEGRPGCWHETFSKWEKTKNSWVTKELQRKYLFWCNVHQISPANKSQKIQQQKKNNPKNNHLCFWQLEKVGEETGCGNTAAEMMHSCFCWTQHSSETGPPEAESS